MNFYNRVPLYPTPAPALTIEPLRNGALPRLQVKAASQGLAQVPAQPMPAASRAAMGAGAKGGR